MINKIKGTLVHYRAYLGKIKSPGPQFAYPHHEHVLPYLAPSGLIPLKTLHGLFRASETIANLILHGCHRQSYENSRLSEIL